MNNKQRYSLVVLLIITIIAATAGGLWLAVSGSPPIIIHDRQYYALIEGFQRADRRDKTGGGGENAGWEFLLQVPDSQTTVRVRVPSSIGVVTIKYSDEGNDRALYRHVDYVSPIEIRTKGDVLYVHWVEPLFGNNHWILAYDLAARHEIAKRRMDPNDKL